MSQHKGIFLLLILTFFGPNDLSKAQSYNIRSRTLGVAEGLSDQYITSVIRTQDYNLWIATEDGLNRYDGFTLKEYNTQNSSLTRNAIAGLHLDGDSALWVVPKMLGNESEYEGPFRYNPDSDDFESWSAIYGTFPFKSTGWFRSVYFQNENVFFFDELGTYWRFNSITRDWSQLSTVQSMKVSNIINGLWIFRNINTHQFIAGQQPDRLLADSTNKANLTLVDFLTTYNKGLNSTILNTTPYCFDSVRKILWAADKNNLYGIRANGELIRFQDNETQINFNRTIRCIYFHDNIIYVGTEGGLHIIKTQPASFRNFFSSSQDILDKRKLNACRGIVADEKYVYAALPDGLYREPLAKTYTPERIIKGNMFPVIYLSDSILLAGKRSLYKYNRQTGKTDSLVEKDNPFRLTVWSLQTTLQHLYVGGFRGLNIFPINSLEDGSIVSMLDETTILGDELVYQTVLTSNDHLMIATDQGLFIAQQNGLSVRQISFLSIQKQPPVFESFVHVLEDEYNTWWAATLDGGIVNFSLEGTKATIIRQLGRNEGLPTNTCYSVYKDLYGNIWSSTDLGIVQLFTKTWTYTFYSSEDGMENVEFNRISHFQDASGNIYFGGLNGVTCFTPSDFDTIPKANTPLRVLRYLQFSGWKDSIVDRTIELQKNKTITLQPGDSFFEIEVGLDDYFNTASHQYEYRLADINEDWLIMNRNKLRVYSMPYGQHSLEIRGKNGDGIYSQQMIHLKIKVLRPFYLRWWFYVIITLGILLMIREYQQSRARRIKALKVMVLERTKKIEEQSEALRLSNEARSRFFANISHELRTPLTLIKAPLQALRSEKMSGDQVEKYMQVIDQNAETLADRIDDLLLFARADAQHIEAKKDSVFLNVLLGKITDYFSTLAEEKSIQIHFHSSLDATQSIYTDKKKVEHIISNFLSNAIKFTPSKGLINIRCSKDSSFVTIRVTDTGPGLSEKDCAQVFNRFYQADNNHAATSGTGIGLSLSKDFAEIIGGTVGVISTEGEGSTFFLTIPFEAAPDDGPSSHQQDKNIPLDLVLPPSPMPTKASHSALKILLVEDHQTMREFLANELSNHQIIQSQNGKEALELLSTWLVEKSLPDLIISDVMMPVMDGFEMLHEIKSHDRLGAIPIIMLTARSGIEDKIEALRIGVDDYIAKPFDMRELVTRIENISARIADKREAANDPESLSVDQQWLRIFEEQVRNNISESRFTMDELALSLNISRRQLYRKVKSYTGLTANMYVREVRLFEARKLLESQSVRTVSELAFHVGFEDPDYFSRVYAERFGKRPSAYL